MKTLSLLSLAGLLIATPACKTASPAAPSAAASTAWSEEALQDTSPTTPGAGDKLETVVILGINDIHGALSPQRAKTRETEGTAPIDYKRGGAAIFARHVEILRQQFGSRVLVLDAGDEFQGTLESNLNEGAAMVQYFNAIGLSAAAIGNHEFDFGPPGPEGAKGDVLGALKLRMSEARFPYVASNIVERGTQKLPDFPNTSRHVILSAGDVKVGVIGLTTLETPGATRATFVRGLEFTDLKEATLREAAALRAKGAHLIVVTAHVGLECDLGRVTAANHVRKPGDRQGECRPDDELVRYLESLPKGTVDAVVSGHSHRVVHHWVAGVPVIQAGTRMAFHNLLYLTYDWTLGRAIPERARIEGPVPVCPRIFANQGDCNGDRPAPREGRGEMVEPTFHGEKVRPVAAVEKLLEPYLSAVESEKRRVVAPAARPITLQRAAESELGNLVTDAMRIKTGADAALVNPGALRAPWLAGTITFEDVFRTLPFDNAVSVLTLTGRELRTVLRIAESGARGFFPVSGLSLRLIEPDSPAPTDDLNRDGSAQAWEVNRLLEVRQADGRAIVDHQKYRLATLDFLVGGGDEMAWIMDQIPRDRVELAAAGIVRDVVAEYMTALAAAQGPLNSETHPLIVPGQPRIKFEKAAFNKGKKSRGKGKGKAKRKRRARRR